MTAAARPTSPVHDSRTHTFAGARTLLRFNLRRDRVRLPVWLLALVLSSQMTLLSFSDLYPTDEDKQTFAHATDTPAALALSGPSHYFTDFNYGAMLSHQLLGFTLVMVALMSIFTVTRHTRQEEETGRAELVRSGVVGRHAYLTAALGVVVVANLLLAALFTVALGGLGLEDVTWHGSLLYGMAHASVGIVFAAIAAVTVQLTAHPRAASGMALAVVGVAYALRAAGDVGGGALSWVSPIGWAQRSYAFVDNNWVPLLLCLLLAAGVSAAAYVLSTRRDLGAGLWASRLGSSEASEALTSPLGLALRLHRGVLTGFAVGMLLLGAMFGALLGDVEQMLDGAADMREALAEMGGASVTESFAALLLLMLATVASVYSVLATLRARDEETSGRAEPLLSTALSRNRWLGGHLTVALLGGLLLLLLTGLGFGVVGALTTGDASLVPKLVGSALLYAPAVWVTAGVATVLFGWLPKWSTLAWIVPVWAFVIGYLGQVLRFPDWTNNLSPFGHVAQAPAEPVNWLAPLLLTVCAAVLLAFGFNGFRRRDLESK